MIEVPMFETIAQFGLSENMKGATFGRRFFEPAENADDLHQEPRFANAKSRPVNADLLYHVIDAELLNRSTDNWPEPPQQADSPCIHPHAL